MTIEKFSRINSVKGILELPGDKSISHRSVMFSSLAAGTSYIRNLSAAEDVASTLSCFRQLGVQAVEKDGLIAVKGAGFKGFTSPSGELYAGNSGTTSRLISGILCAQDFQSIITGDESLSQRPMKRVTEPLGLFGADIRTSDAGTLPIVINKTGALRPVDYTTAVASAQVKSAMLLAAIHIDGQSVIREHEETRDHTERMLGMKVTVENGIRSIYASRDNYPQPMEYFVPSDISTAAFFIVLTLLCRDSSLIIKNISLNPSRTGILQVLRSMGASIEIQEVKETAGEPYGDILVKSSSLKNTAIPKELIPNIIDEIPILSVAGLLAEGEFCIRHARELRVKESDRIKALCDNFRLLGVEAEEYDDGFSLSGSIKNNPVIFDSFGDHRIAMAFAVLSMHLKQGGEVSHFDCVNISNPPFMAQVRKIAGF